MRALWTAASGMKSQQLNIDTISNNLANVNTTGYKKQRIEFKDLLYETLKKPTVEEGQGSPVNIQIGHGVMLSSTSRNFANGTLERTNNETDLAIDGRGFFAVQDAGGNRLYTRDGSFKIGVDGDTKKLVTSEGYILLSEDEEAIELEDGQKDLTIDDDGFVKVKDQDGEIIELGRIMLTDFLNPDGLESKGSNYYVPTSASGEEIVLEDDSRKSKIKQNFLETSNVQIVDEMIKMIMAQRAYDINSKAIQTADEMMQTTNNLRR